MSYLPVQILPAIFIDEFIYPDNELIGTIQSLNYDLFANRNFTVTSTGQILYDTVSLEDLKVKDRTDSANYSFVLRMKAQEGFKFQIRGRYTNDDNYLYLDVDISDNLFRLGGVSNGTELASSEVEHALTIGEYYSIELWVIDNEMFCVINGSKVIEHTLDYFKTVHGFALNISHITDPVTMHRFVVHELLPQVPEQEIEETLLVLNRRILIDFLEDDTTDFAAFKKKHYLWEQGRNIGFSDSVWQSLGFPLKRPSAEDIITSADLDPYLL